MPGHKHSSSSSRGTGGSSKRPSKPAVTYTWVWYCSNCSTGPLNASTDSACPSCQHWRCEYCSVQQVALPANR
ncbi:hypothetical protein GQ607_011350 [Colletotrichum asianum]|uniref:Uncharacterized protein n=1 Tax=Colletotrichum asianum TaxID=702518 RepID=A0A8H3WAV3_9PEZI|nr:hypothetical protein GQ607_011350 [Colletotrichum asianum]